LNALSECFTLSRGFDPGGDQYGHRHAREIENAVSLLKASAKLGVTIAKLKGEHRQNINVLHGEVVPPRRAMPPQPEGEGGAGI
jgi:hypothetical protein